MDFVPITSLLSKYFLPAWQSSESEIVHLYQKYGGPYFPVKKTRYYQLRTAKIDWLTPGISFLPQGLEYRPHYWVMPWASKERASVTWVQRIKRRMGFRDLFHSFTGLIDAVFREGYSHEKGGIPVVCFESRFSSPVYIYLDGNHRMGILGTLAKKNKELINVPVLIRDSFTWEKIESSPLLAQLIQDRQMTKKDARTWFEHVFQAYKRAQDDKKRDFLTC